LAWSLTLEPVYKGVKSYSEISARLSYGKDSPFASQDLLESADELSNSLIHIGLTIAEFGGVGGIALKYANKADLLFSVYQTGTLGFIDTKTSEAIYSIQYDITKLVTSKSTSSSSTISTSNNKNSSDKNLITSIKNTFDKVVNSFNKIIGGLFKKR
jgi:hypothetical protein